MSGSLLEEIRRRMRRGDSIDDVDLELIDQTDLSADEKAALWLYAWSFVPRRAARLGGAASTACQLARLMLRRRAYTCS